jgi:DNA recombination protein RmuC
MTNIILFLTLLGITVVLVVATVLLIKFTSFSKAHSSDRLQLDTLFEKQQRLTEDALSRHSTQLQQLLIENLHKTRESLENRFQQLTQTTDAKLVQINERVEQRLMEGFEKTTATFTDILKRLALIDEAQKNITRLSEDVVSLQSILNDKRSRGAFGEVQLTSLIRNMLPESAFSLQATLPNNTRVDCLLLLPEPTGKVAIDAKFPLESFKRMQSSPTENSFSTQFKQDVKKHINDIASKYILPGTTSDGAVMFLPAEAVFAEIHSNHPDLVELAHQKRVWLTSPSTIMAILTTARAVIKDAATRQQVHLIQEHLAALSRDFSRFEKRMDNLSRHINQAQTDVDEIHISAKKITQRFDKIEKVDLESPEKAIQQEDPVQ